LRAPRGRGRAVSIVFDAAAQKSGMTKAKLKGIGNAYALGKGDLFPVFFPQYIGRWGGTQILGVIGLYVEPFELWWLDIVSKFKRTNRSGGIIIGIYISNFRSMMGATAFYVTEQAEIEEWAAKITELARQIFEPGKDVFDIVCSKQLAGFGLQTYLGPSVKAYAFKIWLHLQRPDIKLPDLIWLDEERIESRQQEYDFLRTHYGDIDP